MPLFLSIIYVVNTDAAKIARISVKFVCPLAGNWINVQFFTHCDLFLSMLPSSKPIETHTWLIIFVVLHREKLYWGKKKQNSPLSDVLISLALIHDVNLNLT